VTNEIRLHSVTLGHWSVGLTR